MAEKKKRKPIRIAVLVENGVAKAVLTNYAGKRPVKVKVVATDKAAPAAQKALNNKVVEKVRKKCPVELL